MVTIAPPSTTWYEWTDPLGQTYRPGDYVVYAGVSGQSARLDVGRVERINRYKVNGDEILDSGHYDYITKTRTLGKPSATVRVVPLRKRDDGTWTDRKVQYNPTTKQNEELSEFNSPKTFQKINHVVKVDWKP